jgi:hypothetical protein
LRSKLAKSLNGSWKAFCAVESESPTPPAAKSPLGGCAAQA